MISFRLSEEEFERFRTYCEEHGIRSISELARNAIQRTIERGEGARRESLEERMAGLEARIEELAQDVRELQENGPRRGNDEKWLASSAAQG